MNSYGDKDMVAEINSKEFESGTATLSEDFGVHLSECSDEEYQHDRRQWDDDFEEEKQIDSIERAKDINSIY